MRPALGLKPARAAASTCCTGHKLIVDNVTVDSEVNGGGGVDRFRIKIWDQASGTIVYDNRLDTGDSAELSDATVIRGGRILTRSD